MTDRQQTPPHLWGIIENHAMGDEHYGTEWCTRCGALKGTLSPYDPDTGQITGEPTTTQYRQPDGPWQDEMPSCRPLGVVGLTDLLVLGGDEPENNFLLKNVGVEAPVVRWRVAELFETEHTTRGKATVSHDASYASIAPKTLEVARCYADCPDLKRRLVRAWVNPEALLDWALTHLPHEATLSSGNMNIGNVAWVTVKIEGEE